MRSRHKALAIGLTVLGALWLGPILQVSATPDTMATDPATTGRFGVAARVYTLEQCMRLAELHYPKIAEALAALKKKQAERDEVAYLPFGEFKARAALGPAPTVRGTSVYSQNTDAALTDNMGLFWRLGVEGVVPLWTFGKLENALDALDAQVEVGRHDLTKAKNDLKVDVRRAFYGLQLARDASLLVRQAADRLDDYIEGMKESVAEGEGDDIELVKTQMYRAELDARASQARQEAANALASLRFLTGAVGSFDIPDEPLTRVEHALAPLPHYLAAASIHRPEVNMARAGMIARRAQVRLAESRFYPDVGLGLSASWSAAPEVTDQTNPFVKDQGNFLSYGAALVLEWKLDFLPSTARLTKAHAELEAMRATQRYALGGVGLEVEKAYHEAAEAGARLDAFDRAADYAKKWLIKVQQGIDIGMFEEDELVEPAKEYAFKQFARMSAVYDYNIALAKLAQATGWRGMLTP